MNACNHSWAEARRGFTSPAAGPGFKGKLTKEVLERALYGFTTVELRCVKCGDIKSTVLLGKVES